MLAQRQHRLDKLMYHSLICGCCRKRAAGVSTVDVRCDDADCRCSRGMNRSGIVSSCGGLATLAATPLVELPSKDLRLKKRDDATPWPCPLRIS